jgi:ADP-L-glycero-D-manno-heptose 6-epimerase
MDKAKCIVVTGGAGFIGSCVVKQLNAEGYENIVVIDNLGSSAKWKNLVGKSFCELLEKHQCFEWLDGRAESIGAFIHLGACSSTVEGNASYLLDNNYRFSIRLAEYALKHNQRFIYASSAATYGDGALGFTDDEASLKMLQPMNMYGYSKHLFDLWLQREGLLNCATGLKYFNVFGPNEAHKGRMASAILHLLPLIQREGKVRLFQSTDLSIGDGEQSRDFIYVKDVARMTCAFLQHSAHGIYNIGTGIASTWNALAEAMFKALDRPVNIEYVPMPTDLVGNYQNYTCADMMKTRSVLADEANCFSLDQAVRDYVCNHLIPGKLW